MLSPTCPGLRRGSTRLSYNGLNLKLKVNIRTESDMPRIADEKTQTKRSSTELSGWSRCGRVSIVLMAFSGFRPESHKRLYVYKTSIKSVA